MFDDIDLKKIIPDTQKNSGGLVKKKGPGRRLEPEKGRFHIKMPYTLHTQLSETCKKMGINKSAFIVMAVREKLKSIE